MYGAADCFSGVVLTCRDQILYMIGEPSEASRFQRSLGQCIQGALNKTIGQVAS